MIVIMRTICPQSGATLRESKVRWYDPTALPFVVRHLTWAFNNRLGVAFINAKQGFKP